MAGSKNIATRKQADREALIKGSSVLTEGDVVTLNEFVDADAATIVQNIKNRVPGWTATAVVTAFIRRAIVAQREVNCITEVLFEDALEQAKELDNEFERTGRVRGPLHGVPFSAKDLFRVANEDATIGYTQWAYKPSTETSEVVQLVKNAGGIVFAKTNVPQTMLSFECSNPLWGRTLNPHTQAGAKAFIASSSDDSSKSDPAAKAPKSVGTYDETERRFTCGGSSGGEAALLASDGTAMGLGSDIGGSLRIPSHFCGIYAIKPSPGRISNRNVAVPNPGFDGIPVSYGPMGRTVEDIRLGSEVLFGHLHAPVPLPYRPELAQEVRGRKLKFGYFLSDECIKASPACQRAVIETVEALKKAGHECVLFAPPSVVEAFRIFVGLSAADGYRGLLSHLGSDKLEDSLFLVTLGPKLPDFVRNFVGWVVNTFIGDHDFATLFKTSKRRTISEYFAFAAERDNYNKTWEEEVWQKQAFDGIICPVMATPALPHGATKTLSPLAVSTIYYNLVKCSVGIVPVTRVDPAKDQLSDEWKGPEWKGKTKTSPPSATSDPASAAAKSTLDSEYPSGPHGSKILEQGVYEGSMGNPKVYDPESMAGLPVGVQIVGRLNEDEKVLELMKIVDEALGPAKDRGFGPGSSARWIS